MNDRNQELFRSSFSSMYDAGNRIPRTMIIAKSQRLGIESINGKDEKLFEAASGYDLVEIDASEYAIQIPIREWFGKIGINSGKIGAHPDFDYLDGTDEFVNHNIATIFIDIQNSTRLSLRYDLCQVQKIKNTILRAASETVRALDGHVHRFMGDALMAYFGGVNQDRESACLAAINCSAMLRLLMDEAIVPGLKKQEVDPSDIGFRVGIDYGGDDEVLWSSYGYTDVSEVTATSFFVDSAAKLQSMASKDNSMLGDNLVKYLDFPDDLSRKKTELCNGESVPVLYLRPNYELPNGGCHNYKIHELNFGEFVKILPIPLRMRERLVSGLKNRNGIDFKAFIFDENSQNEYKSISKCVDKGVQIKFQISIAAHALNGLRLPLRGLWTRKNHGKQATDADMIEDELVDFEVKQNNSNLGRECKIYKLIRNAEYRGIHTMNIQIFDSKNNILYSDVIGIHVR